MAATSDASLSVPARFRGLCRLPDNRIARIRQQFVFCLIATFIDGIGTFLHLSRGATEANPLWNGMIDQFGAVPAMAFRILVGVLLLTVLFGLRREVLAQTGIKIMVFAFVPLTLYHLFLLLYLPMIS